MVEELGSDYFEIARSHWTWIALSVIIVIVSLILGGTIGPELSKTIIQRLLTTLVTAVASVLAIAFSVLFISTQIASERYSPGFTASFVNDPIVQLSFGLGITSIISNLIILAVSPSVYQFLGAGSNECIALVLWSAGGFLLGLNVVFFLLLYPFIRLILIQTTPDNILSQFKRQYDAVRFREEAEKAEKVSNHPMQPIYDFARNAMKRGDYNAAISAVEALYEVPKNLLPGLVKNDDLDVESVFGPILNEYGEALIKQADDTQYDDVISTASEGMSELGSKAVSLSNKQVFDEVFSTAYSLIEDDSQFSDETNLAIVECCSNLFSNAASEPGILEEYVPRQSRLVNNIAEGGSIQQLESCLNGAATAHNKYVLSAQSSLSKIRLEEVLLGNRERKPAWERADAEGPHLLIRCVFLLMQTTGAVLSLCNDTNPPGYIYEAWESTIKESHDQGLDTHLEHLIRRYLELVVYTEINHNSALSASNRIAGIVTDEGLRESVLSSCQLILNEDRSNSEINEFQFLERNLPEIWEPIPLTEYPDEFVSIVEEIRDEVQDS